ncbi:hypothetical protein [Saccharicrinis aurantiacus]|uniref:Cbp1 family collagen-binding glycoprotein adhesin n=1 Tax=Saccharicrinis aurantiacus TaxID=1849719 RepID=UPI00083877BD|nr:hypothetical protein [Saccharicrinis aurantiacus]
MKKLIALPLLVLLFACNNQGHKTTQEQNDSLIIANAELEKISNELVTSLISIDDNLQEIKKKENLIDVNLNSSEKNSRSIQDQINSDIQSIYDLMLANKAEIAALEKQLISNHSSDKKLNDLVTRLNRQLEEKRIEIIKLKEQINKKDIQIAALNFTVEGMEQVLDSLNKENKGATSELKMAVKKLYTAYYSFGTKKELKEHKILTADGFLSKAKLLEDSFNENYFTEIDIRETDSIALYRPKVKILSNHPNSSYSIDTDDEGNKLVVITDKDAFWSISKFFVAQVN